MLSNHLEIGSNGEQDGPTKFAVLGGICGQKKAKEKVTQGCRLYAKWRNEGISDPCGYLLQKRFVGAIIWSRKYGSGDFAGSRWRRQYQLWHRQEINCGTDETRLAGDNEAKRLVMRHPLYVVDGALYVAS